MNTKKNKHKKPKSTNTSGSVVAAQSEESEKLEDVNTGDLVKSDKENQPKDDLTNILENQNAGAENAPVKPKRKKGKKKNVELPSENMAVPETSNNEVATSTHTCLNETEKSDFNSDREIEVTVSRKKKKGKKKSNKTEEESIDDKQSTPQIFVEKLESENISSDIKNETPIQKKHKKKKHSENSELTSCTSAFQKLLEPGECQEQSHLSDSSYAEESAVKSNQSVETLTGNKKKKKKNKKGKNQVIEIDASNPPSITKDEKIVEKVDEITDIVIEEQKPKAVIAKPVDKKRKSRISEDTSPATVIEDMISNSPVPEDGNKTIKANKDTDAGLEVKKKEKNKDSGLSDVVLRKEIEEDNTLKETNKSTEQIYEEIQSCDNKFTEARPSRKKKKSTKITDKENINETEKEKGHKTNMNLNIPTSSQKGDLKEEESIITPDLIQYPRSSSQQQFDNNNNNNMVIQEINTPDQAQLGIPILMSVPVIEGSGESPEVRSKQNPLDVKVIELQSETKGNSVKDYSPQLGQDKTQEIKDLKCTIEKSLAELTELERKNLEAEREFTEVLEYNLKSSNTTEEEKLLKESILIPECETIPEQSEESVKDSKTSEPCAPPMCPERKDKKSKSKKKGKKPPEVCSATSPSSGTNISGHDSNKSTQETRKNENKDKTSDTQGNKGKQQSTNDDNNLQESQDSSPLHAVYEPIEKFEDALTSSTEDVNDTFEMIAKEANELPLQQKLFQKPEISVTEPEDDTKANQAKVHPVSQPKNLLGHPNIPAQSNRTDYKKEKNKPPNTMSAKVKIRDGAEIEKARIKDADTKNKLLKKTSKGSCSYKINANDDFVYKYSFRKVFLPNVCHVCMKELGPRVACKFCNLLFYCSQKHKDEDWPQHQFLCFVVCTMVHLKEQKFIYGDAQNITGHEYRVLRMQIIISCEKMLKRKLVPWEQEALLYPRICSGSACREWRQGLLSDCRGCGQVSYCTEHPEHLPISHQRWCKAYALYQKLVSHQQKLGRLDPALPSKVLPGGYLMPDTMTEVLTSLYEEKLDMNDVEYAALTQIATAPFTAAYGYQTVRKNINGLNERSTFTIHIVGAELQFEADVLNKWEIFFLHLRPDVKDLRVILISRELNPSNLPLDLLSKIKLCETCRLSNRRLLFKFIDKKSYQDYYNSDEFLKPDIVCSFNQSIERSSIYNGRDHWPSTIKCVSELKCLFLITGYTLNELSRDLSRVQKLANFNVSVQPKLNNFASVRPDRNFITDDEMPLLFKNYCYTIVCG